MYIVSISYPNHDGSFFNADYYINKHMPNSIEKLGDKIKGVFVEIGENGIEPNSMPQNAASCYFICDSAQDFIDAFMPHAEELQGDIVNYTNIIPKVQFGVLNIMKEIVK